MVWMSVFPPPKFICWQPNTHGDSIGRWDLGEVIALGIEVSGETSQLGLAPFKRGPRDLAHPLPYVKTQNFCDLGPHSAMLPSWSQTFSLQKHEKFSLFISQTVCDILLSQPEQTKSSKMTAGIESTRAKEASEKKGYPTYLCIRPRRGSCVMSAN